MSEFKEFLKEKYPNIETERLYTIIENEINSIVPTPGADLEMNFPITSDIIKALIFKTVQVYNEQK